MIIGLTGYAGSGKSLTAQALISDGWEHRKFAAPLKNMLRTFLAGQGADLDTRERMIEGDLKEVPSLMLGGKTPRHAMQALGTEWGRLRLSDSLWVDAALRAVVPTRPTVIDDVRFENEAEGIRALGGKIIQVMRPGVGRASNHSSECLVMPDFILINDSTPEELHRRALDLVQNHLVKRST